MPPPSPHRGGRRSGSRGPADGNLAAVSHGQHVPTPTAVTCRSEASITQLQNSGKIADGLTIVPWTRGRCLEWDYTRSDTLATSHLSTAVLVRARQIPMFMTAKSPNTACSLSTLCDFMPIAVETGRGSANQR